MRATLPAEGKLVSLRAMFSGRIPDSQVLLWLCVACSFARILVQGTQTINSPEQLKGDENEASCLCW